MVKSLKFDNSVFGIGGELKKEETVLDGLFREAKEEAPSIAEILLEVLKNEKRAVGMYRESRRGIHSTFLISLPDDFDFDKAKMKHDNIVAMEKADLNRADYLETDGGLLAVPLYVFYTAVASGINGGEMVLPDVGILRKIVYPVFNELLTLIPFKDRDYGAQAAVVKTHSFYKHFLNVWGISGVEAVCMECLHCKAVKWNVADFLHNGLSDGKLRLFCPSCSASWHRSLSALKQAAYFDDKMDFLALANAPLREYTGRIEAQK